MAKPDEFRNRAAACEAHDDIPRSPPQGKTIGEVIFRRYSRREVMRGTLGVTAATALFGPAALAASQACAEDAAGRFKFAEIESGIDETHHLAPGYRAQILLRWGDPLFPDVPEFNPNAQSAADQLKRFGYNDDYIAFFPIDDSATRALLCVNHEYTNQEVMFPGIKKRQDTTGFGDMTADLVDIEMAAHGVSIVEIERDGDDWQVLLGSKYNRRISPDTPMTADGPAAGDERLKTSTAAKALGARHHQDRGRQDRVTSRLLKKPKLHAS